MNESSREVKERKSEPGNAIDLVEPRKHLKNTMKRKERGG